MTPQSILSHHDNAQLWSGDTGLDVPAAYQTALALRGLRTARGEQPRGYKIGFTNASIWPRYNVSAPVWGTVYDSTLAFCEGSATLSLGGISQPRIEPEAVLCMLATPPENATLQELFACIDWVAPGFEIVQSHMPDWKFAAADAVADGALHARLVVGQRTQVRSVASKADDFCAKLAACSTTLSCNGKALAQGVGANVLGDPLHALLHFMQELRQCPQAPDLLPGDVVTTGTWTDAWPVAARQVWTADFDAPLSRLELRFD